MTEEKRLDLQNRRLRGLVSYAKTNSPYFATRYQEIDENTPLTALPSTSKADMAVHFDEWMTDTSITKGKVEHFMEDSSNIDRKLDGKYLVYTTSGSTGNPCVVLYDASTIKVSSAVGVLRSFARKQDMYPPMPY